MPTGYARARTDEQSFGPRRDTLRPDGRKKLHEDRIAGVKAARRRS